LSGKKSGSAINKLENIFLALVFGGIAPIFCFLTGWWGAYFFTPENQIPIFMLAGLGLGIVIDLLFLGKWIRSAYDIHPMLLLAIYLSYSVGIFGFFMGVPFFNIVMGPLAGFYIGRRLGQEKTNPEKTERIIHWTGLFASFVLAVACLAALLLAASEFTLAANINGMLHDLLGLNTSFDNQIILILSALAGAGIVIAEYYLTQAAAKKAFHL
jgi:hypothetical protein